MDQVFLMKNSEKMDSEMSSEASETASAIRRHRKKRSSSNSGAVSPYESIKLEATFNEIQKGLGRIEQLEKTIQQQATEITLLKNKGNVRKVRTALLNKVTGLPGQPKSSVWM